MKKILLSVLLTVLILCNVTLLVKMSNGDSKQDEIPSDIISEISNTDTSDQTDIPASNEAQKDKPNYSQVSNKLETVFDVSESFKDYSSSKIGNEIGNYAANAYNGGYAINYDKNVYYIDINNSNYPYFTRNDLSVYNKINKVTSMYINIYENKIFYVNQDDGCLWSKRLGNSNNKKIGKLRAVCPVAVDKSIYYIMPQDENSLCGEIHCMSSRNYSDEKISPDGFICENIIPCGDFMLFVSVGKEDKSICMLNLATSKVTKLYSGDISDINYSKGVLWFVRHKGSIDEICKVSSGSDTIEVVTSAASIDNLIVVKGYAFYIFSDAYNKCARIPIDSDTPEIIYDNQNNEILSFNVMDKFIYFEASNINNMCRLIPGKTSVTKMPTAA